MHIFYKPYKWNFTAQEGKGDRDIGAMGDEGSRPVSVAHVAETPQ